MIKELTKLILFFDQFIFKKVQLNFFFRIKLCPKDQSIFLKSPTAFLEKMSKWEWNDCITEMFTDQIDYFKNTQNKHFCGIRTLFFFFFCIKEYA